MRIKGLYNLISCWAILTAFPAFSQNFKAINIAWLPITQAELDLKGPLVDKDAGAEVLFWTVHVVDEVTGQDLQRILYHYVRLKVFDEKGKAAVSTIEIKFGKRTGISSVKGRTVKADGTVLELDKDAIHERDLVRGKGVRQKVMAFAMPGVEPGAIVEYRWREIWYDPPSTHMRLHMQREFPVEKVTYYLQPVPGRYTEYQMYAIPFHCQPTPLKQDRDGFSFTTVEKVPALKDEPMMPGEANVSPWVLIAYWKEKHQDPDKYWSNAGKELYRQRLKPALKTNNEIRQAAAKAVEGAADDEAKVVALIRYVRANVRDLYGSKVTDAERAKIIGSLPNDRLRTSEEVFKSGIGSANELNTLFAAMATSVGLDARPAMVADAADIAFDPSMADSYFLSNVDMAVKIGDRWKLYDASARLLPSKMVSWREEGMKALVSDSKAPVFIDSPLTPPTESACLRTAYFRLSDDGVLEGDVRESYSGHEAHQRRVDMEDESEARRLERLQEKIAQVFPNAGVSATAIENADDAEQPLRIRYHVKIEGYAQRTGRRLLLQPMFFQRGATPLFPSAERRYPIRFPYGWREFDAITVALPEEFELDNAEKPHPLEFGKTGRYEVRMSINAAHELVCSRELIFGGNGLLVFFPDSYPQVKAVFDQIQRNDEHAIALVRRVSASTR